MANETFTLQRVVKSVLSNPLRAFSLAKKQLSKPAVTENSSYCYVREDAQMSTTIYLYNYWSENYKIDRPEIKFEVLSAEGGSLGTYAVTLEPNGSAAVKVGAILNHLNIKTPFEGSVLTTIASPNLREGRPLQMNVDYFYQNGKRVTGVHSQWGVTREKKKELMESFHMVVNSSMNTHVVLRNTLSDKTNNGNSTPVISLINHAGERLQKTISPIKPRGMLRLDAREHFPTAETFLAGKSGNLELMTETEMGRCLFYHYAPENEFYAFDHATQHHAMKGDYSFSNEEMKLMGIGPVAVGPVIIGKEKDTYLIPFVDFMGNEKEYSIDVSVFDKEGKIVAERKKAVTLHPHEVGRIAFSELLRGTPVEKSFEGTYRASMHVQETIAKYPRTFHVITGYVSQGQHTEYQFDSGLFNMHENNLSNEYQTTKVFSRILSTPDFNTVVCLINSSGGMHHSKSSSTLVSVFNPSGETVGEKTVIIPPNGCAFLTLDELFPSLREVLKKWDGNGVIKVRDTTARIVGPHFIQDVKGNLICSDHLVGG